MKTSTTKPTNISINWILLDASDMKIGKIATIASKYLIGKNKPYYTNNLVCGDKVIIINSNKLSITIKKQITKMYYRHSGYIGGLKAKSLEELLHNNPKKIIEIAVKGMLPKTKLGSKMFNNLYVYNDEKHKHENIEIKTIKI